MAKVLVSESNLSDIADAIRLKKNSQGTYTPAEMASAIVTIPTGSSAALITKTITENGTYNAASDNADGYSSVTVNVPSGGGGALEPFDTYEFNVPSDINYLDETGTDMRTLATIAWHQATLEKIDEYANILITNYPFAQSGYARILFSVQPKNPTTFSADATYTKNARKDTCIFVKNTNGTLAIVRPTWRAIWRLKANGSFAYGGGFNTSNDYDGFDVSLGDNLVVQTQLSKNGGQMISAGDYVVKLYDLTRTVV